MRVVPSTHLRVDTDIHEMHDAEQAHVQAQQPPLSLPWTLVPWLLLSLVQFCTERTRRSARLRQQGLTRLVALQACCP